MVCPNGRPSNSFGPVHCGPVQWTGPAGFRPKNYSCISYPVEDYRSYRPYSYTKQSYNSSRGLWLLGIAFAYSHNNLVVVDNTERDTQSPERYDLGGDD